MNREIENKYKKKKVKTSTIKTIYNDTYCRYIYFYRFNDLKLKVPNLTPIFYIILIWSFNKIII